MVDLLVVVGAVFPVRVGRPIDDQYIKNRTYMSSSRLFLGINSAILLPS